MPKVHKGIRGSFGIFSQMDPAEKIRFTICYVMRALKDNVTLDNKKVTCKWCLKIMEKRK